MIKKYDDKIEIYTQIDIKEIKLARNIFSIGLILEISCMIFLPLKILHLVATIITAFLELVCIYIIKKEPEPKHTVTLTKEYIEIYKKDKTERYNMEDIINFSYDTSSSSFNEVFINYTKKNKKCSKILFLRGCSNKEFVDMANKVKTYGTFALIPDAINIKEQERSNYKTERELVDFLLKGNELKLCFIGKSKLLVKQGDKYNLENQKSKCLFTDEFGNLVHFGFEQMHIDILKLVPNTVFIVKYNKKKDMYHFTTTSESFEKSVIDNIKNREEIHEFYIFDYEDIKVEYNIERKIYISLRLFLILFLLSCIFLFINKVVSVLLFLIACLYPSISILKLKKQCIK